MPKSAMRKSAKRERVTQREKTKSDRKQLLIMRRRKLKRKNLARNFRAEC